MSLFGDTIRRAPIPAVRLDEEVRVAVLGWTEQEIQADRAERDAIVLEGHGLPPRDTPLHRARSLLASANPR